MRPFLLAFGVFGAVAAVCAPVASLAATEATPRDVVPAPASPDVPVEVPPGSDLRKALFNILRPRVEAQAGAKVLFEGRLKSSGNWAFFLGRSVGVDGSRVVLSDLGNDDTVALWLRTRDGWTLVDYDAGGSDAFYTEWSKQYGTPMDLLIQ